MVSSPPMRMGQWVYFSGPVGYLLFHMDTGGTPSYRAYGRVRIRDFSGGDSSTNFLPSWQMQVYKTEFIKLSQRSL